MVDDAALLIGIKINPGQLIGVIIGLTAEIRAEQRIEPSGDDVDSVVTAAAELVVRLRAEAGALAQRVIGVGVAVSGDVDSRGGIVRASARLGWQDVPLAARLRDRTGLPVLIENDVRALTIAEHWFGVGVDMASFAIITLGTGIGCGLHVGGEVVEGAFGVAGEIGHLPIADTDRVCSCGRRACLETVASSAAILDEIRAGTKIRS